MVCNKFGGKAKGNSYGQWRRVVVEVSAKPKIDRSKEVLVRHPK